MQPAEAYKLLLHNKELKGWEISERVKKKSVLILKKTFKFGSSMQGADFVHALWQKAEENGHHPDILLKYRRTAVEWTTHAISGLSRNDFIMAAVTEEVYGKFSS